ncbi:ABC transporter ATP-binding protein [Aquabacterium sp.]|uniref:ABC transporter ATP-binding protein n=1 Tax=Aquabacterium sp. TaxID=1872578 RepID=UPI00378518CB
MADLALRALSQQFGGVPILHQVDLEVADGEFLVLVGPSGCGKSTLLRLIAGLDAPSGGDILIGGVSVRDLPPAERGVAMVFQSYALYPHLTVAQNMGFALKMAGVPAAEAQRRVAETAESLQLGALLDRKPGALSGGQRQRVAIGRAIVRRPRVFLFDEPLSNLDAALRVQMRMELARLHRELGTTMVYVTHDQVEAMTLGQRIAVFDRGRLVQAGSPLDLFDRPSNRFVAGFLGSPRMNFLPLPALAAGGPRLPALPDGACTLGVRPEHLRPADGADGLRVTVDLVERLGDSDVVHATLDGGAGIGVAMRLPARAADYAPRTRLTLQPDLQRLHWFDADGRALAPAPSPSPLREFA